MDGTASSMADLPAGVSNKRETRYLAWITGRIYTLLTIIGTRTSAQREILKIMTHDIMELRSCRSQIITYPLNFCRTDLRDPSKIYVINARYAKLDDK